MGNGAYLVNGTDGNGNHRSGVAWYSLLGRFNDANQPDAYADVQGVEPGHFVQWENQQIQGKSIPSLDRKWHAKESVTSHLRRW